LEQRLDIFAGESYQYASNRISKRHGQYIDHR
jgi:hypothetical protein